MTNAVHHVAEIDPMQFANRAEHAGSGWWAAVALVIVVCGAIWILRYLVSQNGDILKDLKATNAATIGLLTGVVETNTASNNAVRNELAALRLDVGRVETAVRDAKMSVRREATHG